jgi:hypothetical protein
VGVNFVCSDYLEFGHAVNVVQYKMLHRVIILDVPSAY